MCKNHLCLHVIPWSYWGLLFSFVYAATCYIERRKLWEELSWLSNITIPSLIVGDTNAILHTHEKSGGSDWITAGNLEFVDFVNHCLQPIMVKRNFMSWCNNHDNSHNRIYEATDKGLASSSWISTYTSTTIQISRQIGLRPSTNDCSFSWSC